MWEAAAKWTINRSIVDQHSGNISDSGTVTGTAAYVLLSFIIVMTNHFNPFYYKILQTYIYIYV